MTNVKYLFNNLVELGQHPKEYTDTITIMEKIGHFLDAQVRKIYKDLKKEGFTKSECSPLITERLKVSKILKKSSKDWDGGYVIGGMIGHGDSFILRDPAGIRPAYYYKDDEVIVVASERPAIQTAFNLKLDQIKEVPAGKALLINKAGEFNIKEILPAVEKKACSFERIYFSRGSDADIYKERKELGKLIMPTILKEIKTKC